MLLPKFSMDSSRFEQLYQPYMKRELSNNLERKSMTFDLGEDRKKAIMKDHGRSKSLSNCSSLDV
ncbi:hypothetical protein CR513_59443, partial [Mucuna pruriens]